MLWADQEVLEAMGESVPPPTDTRELYSHVLSAEAIWLGRLHGVLVALDVWPMLDLDDCRALAERNRADWSIYMEKLSAEELSREVDYKNSSGQSFRSRVDDILLHVMMHGAYHRGQISRAFRQEGSAPRPTDYIAFARGAPCATRTARP